MDLKRLWDTENKRTVWAIWPSWKPCQLWTNEEWTYIYIYDDSKWYGVAVWEDMPTGIEYVWANRIDMGDEMVGYYDTNEPTELFNWDVWDKASYLFLNWSVILDSGTVDEWETPVYEWETPTKSATAQYTYTFSWWKPTVWPITKSTTYKAQFTSTVNKYDVTIASNDESMWTVDVAFVEWQPYWTAISVEDNVLTIGETEVTATAETGYVFSSWWTLPETVTWDLTITATFEAELD